MNQPRYLKVSQRALATLAVLFGALTIFAGFRALAGTSPGYAVFLPLLIYNTVMGFVYVVVGAISWGNLKPGKNGAFAIFVLNLIVLAVIGIAYVPGGEVAIPSFRAMVLRTVVWLVIFSGLWWLGRRSANAVRDA